MYLFTFLSFCTSNYLVGILLVLIGLPRFLLLFLSPTEDTAYPLCLDIGYYYTNHSKHLHSKQISHSSLVCIVRSVCDCKVKLCPLQKKKKIWNCVSLHITGSGGVRHTLGPLNLRACHLEIASKPEEPRVTKLPTSTKSLQAQKVTVTMSSGNWLSMRKPCNRDTKQFKFQRWTCS